jgi:transposase
MFIRVKQSKNSPRKSVQIVGSFRKGKHVIQKTLRYVGVAQDEEELVMLKQLAETLMVKIKNEAKPPLFSPDELAQATAKSEKEDSLVALNQNGKAFQVDLRDLKEESRSVEGIHEVYGALYEQLGLGCAFGDRTRRSGEIFKEMVLARVASPRSKKGTTDYLERQFGQRLDVNAVYRMMDRLNAPRIEALKKKIYTETVSLFDQKLDVVFFDVTTLYYESFEEDDFRKNGMSKDMKFNQPQVVLALLVTKEGLPVGYEAFPGNTYEGHTLVPCLKELRTKYNVTRAIFVADSGMCNEANLNELQKEGFEYIVGARLKNQALALTEQMLDPTRFVQISPTEKLQAMDHPLGRLIVHHSQDRARKNRSDRRRAVERLAKKLTKQKTLKATDLLGNYGHKKYLKALDGGRVSLDEDKIQADEKWDGLLGVLSNAIGLSNVDLVRQYQQLWVIEQAFRIQKHSLAIRPIYHFKKERIQAHIAICFAAFALMAHLRYRVKIQQEELSLDKIREELLTVQASLYYNKANGLRYRLPSHFSDTAKKIYKVLNLHRNLTAKIISA